MHWVRDGARMPALWVFEMSNVLAMAERRGRVAPGQVERFEEALLALPIELDRSDGAGLMPVLTRLARAQGWEAPSHCQR